MITALISMHTYRIYVWNRWFKKYMLFIYLKGMKNTAIVFSVLFVMEFYLSLESMGLLLNFILIINKFLKLESLSSQYIAIYHLF